MLILAALGCGALFNSTLVRADARVSVELATEPGLQITAPQEWLQLLADVGLTQIRARGLRRNEKPAIDNRGSEQNPRYHVLGILTARGELIVPGGKFHRNDRAKLKDYFDHVAADGPEAVTAHRGRFGLTERQLTALHEDLAQPIAFAARDQATREIVRQLQTQLAHEIDSSAMRRGDALCQYELRGLSAGTVLAFVLRDEGLALRPEKPRGREVVLRIRPIAPTDNDQNTWPVGWKPEASPRQLAPELFEYLNVEIAGHSLRQAINAIQARLQTRIVIDPWVLAEHKIDVDKVQINLPRDRTYYKRIIDRVVAQGRLHGELRVDEAGTPFYWVTR